MARTEVVKQAKTEDEQSQKVEKVVEEKSPKAKRGRPAVNSATTAKSPKPKKDSVKKIPMKAKANGVKSAKEPTKHPSTSKMVTEAFTLLKNRKGHTLYAIKKFITDNYNCQISSQINNNIKKYLAEEFEAGRIKMTDSDADKIKFNQRFALSK